MPHPRLHWSAYLWPGLPQAWLRGSWVGLALAVGFTALTNVLLAATLVWDEWLPPRARWVGLAALGVIWVVAWVDVRADWRRMLAEWSAGEPTASDADAASDQGFREAQMAYLAHDWVSTEKTLIKLLRHDARDAESRLLLATLWRHEGRLEAAGEELDRLACLETAAPWQYEIARERERICAACVERAPREESMAKDDPIGGASPDQAWSGLPVAASPQAGPRRHTNRSKSPANGGLSPRQAGASFDGLSPRGVDHVRAIH